MGADEASEMEKSPRKVIRRIGVLTGGGDSPGLNAAIRAACLTAVRKYGVEIVGLVNGFSGLFMGEEGFVRLDEMKVQDIHPLGGTILGTANRGNPFRLIERDEKGHPILDDSGDPKVRDRSAEAVERIKELGIDGLICVGGDGTLSMAQEFYDKYGVPVVGVPKTIDFDLSGTEATFGFKTAVQVACDALDRLRTTADSHDRVLILEVMGRYAGWIALHAGIAGGAHAILIPEIPYDTATIWRRVTERFRRSRKFSLVVVAEGARPEGGDYAVMEEREHPAGMPVLGGAGMHLRMELESINAAEAKAIREQGSNPPEAPEIRVVVLGHVQRGGTPLAEDRVIASACGSYAVDMVMERRFGHMSAWHHDGPNAVKLETATEPHLVVIEHESLVTLARSVGICLGDRNP